MRLSISKLVLTLLIVCALPIAMVNADTGQTQFFEAIQDLPLMPGLEELSDQAILFDKPQGRIIETTASMDSLSQEQVQDYYESALPAFGWSQTSENTYKSGVEHLYLSFERIENHSFLKIMVRPE